MFNWFVTRPINGVFRFNKIIEIATTLILIVTPIYSRVGDNVMSVT